MKDIIKTKSGNMNVSTFSSIQTVKYSLKSRNITAVQCFHRPDTLHNPVDHALVTALRKSASNSKHKAHQAEIEGGNRDEEGRAWKNSYIYLIQISSQGFERKGCEKSLHSPSRVCSKEGEIMTILSFI
ncbi:hypothetical protein ElyMa_001046300 [Elysia marginata]|uniref:Uncharacterized protein n=1 Tax=Elysia marginata TaxID=1093978 RepID=A0AAV4HP61_9GAST|nr:hypothetical protein ElyMa_001046300 [Elysia marginata]